MDRRAVLVEKAGLGERIAAGAERTQRSLVLGELAQGDRRSLVTARCTSTPPQTKRTSTGPIASSETVGENERPLLAATGLPSRLAIDQA